METTVVRTNYKGDHDIYIQLDPGATLTFEGGWHEIEIEGAVLAVLSAVEEAGGRTCWVKMTTTEMERINRAYCGMSRCTCGSGLGQIDPIRTEPGNWWVRHESDEARDLVAEALAEIE